MQNHRSGQEQQRRRQLPESCHARSRLDSEDSRMRESWDKNWTDLLEVYDRDRAWKRWLLRTGLYCFLAGAAGVAVRSSDWWGKLCASIKALLLP